MTPMTPSYIHGNIVWGSDQVAHAVFQLGTIGYGYLNDAQKVATARQLSRAFASLPNETVLISPCVQLDPHRLSRAMLASSSAPAWRGQVDDVVHQASSTSSFSREVYVVVRLDSASGTDSVRHHLHLLTGALADVMGTVRPSPRQRDVHSAQVAAQQVLVRLEPHLEITPASSQQVQWLCVRSAFRGILEPQINEQNGRRSQVLRTDAVLTEGGHSDDPGRFDHRYVRVETESGVSYQTFMPIAQTPREMVFPNGTEWFALIDAVFEFPVEWYVTMRPTASRRAKSKVHSTKRRLQGNVDEYIGDPAGAPEDLFTALEGADQLEVQLAESDVPIVHVATVVALASQSLEDLQWQIDRVRAGLEVLPLDLPRPTGAQIDLFTGSIPGCPVPKTAKQYEQVFTPEGAAAAMPIAGSDLGDPQGFVVGHSAAGGGRPVLVDLALGPTINESGSVIGTGNLGSGKSMGAKTIIYWEVAKGSQVVVFDKTDQGEYAVAAAAMPGATQVVNLGPNPQVRLDPMQSIRLDDPAQEIDLRIKATRGFLSLCLGVSPQSEEGSELRAVIDRCAEAQGTINDICRAVEGPLGDRLRMLEASSELKSVFDSSLPLVNLGADYVVLWTPNLDLPDMNQLQNPVLAAQISQEQYWAQAYVFLVSAIARATVSADRSRFGLAVFDEAWSLASSPQGAQLLIELTRDGRKRNAAAMVLSQSPDHAPEELYAYATNTFMFRQDDSAQAALQLKALGMDQSPANVELIQSLRNGQCVYRDRRGRVGLVNVAVPDRAYEAFDTRPGASTRLGGFSQSEPVGADR